jgi:hypothetical protein
VRRLSILRGLVPFVLAAGAAATAGSGRAGESLTVSNVSAAPVTSSLSLRPGDLYRLQVTGTVSDWCTDTSCATGDPAAVPQPGVGVDALYCYAAWRCPTPQNWSALRVNGVGLDELTLPARPVVGYSDSHAYTAYVAGIRGPLSFVAADAAKGSSADNSGAFAVTIADLGPAVVGYAFACHGRLRCAGRGQIRAGAAERGGALRFGPYRFAATSGTVLGEGGTLRTLVVAGHLVSAGGRGCPAGTPVQLTLAADAAVLQVFCGPPASHLLTAATVRATFDYVP